MSVEQKYTEQHATFTAIADKVDELDEAADALVASMFGSSAEITVVRVGDATAGDWTDTYEQGGHYHRSVTFWERKYRASWWEYL